MSRFDYLESKRLSMEDVSFASLIMAAYRRADTANAMLLRGAFPDLCDELQARYNAPGGYLDGEVPDLPLHRTQANVGVSCSTCDDGGCPDCTDPA